MFLGGSFFRPIIFGGSIDRDIWIFLEVAQSRDRLIIQSDGPFSKGGLSVILNLSN